MGQITKAANGLGADSLAMTWVTMPEPRRLVMTTMILFLSAPKTATAIALPRSGLSGLSGTTTVRPSGIVRQLLWFPRHVPACCHDGTINTVQPAGKRCSPWINLLPAPGLGQSPGIEPMNPEARCCNSHMPDSEHLRGLFPRSGMQRALCCSPIEYLVVAKRRVRSSRSIR